MNIYDSMFLTADDLERIGSLCIDENNIPCMVIDDSSLIEISDQSIFHTEQETDKK